MKLILSSCDFLNEKSKKVILDNLDKKLEEYKILFIPNEKVTSKKINSSKYYNRLREDGFTNRDNIYIFDENSVDSFRNLDIELIYISGGNTFTTMDKLRKSNFTNDIITYIKNGVIYIGGSCGAHIVTKNIKHVEYFDENYVRITDFSGLGLFDGIIIAHYDDTRKEILEKLKKENRYKIYTLTNEQSLVVENNNIKKI